MMPGFVKKHMTFAIFVYCFVFVLMAGGMAISKEASAAVPAEWGMDIDCQICHTNEAKTMSNKKSLLSFHSGESCVSCHSQESILASVHKKMSTDTSRLRRLKKTTVSNDICIDCHGGWADLSALTKDSSLIRDSEGTTINPHIVTTELNKSKQHNRITCTSCHQMHTDTALEVAANSLCETCHHAGVYTCGTCHD